ncbi:uncharacterized protein LOC123220908 [Mangifera indica]|uniref:uncharacterized protein LOC123220908 n=1 Tax=Mangifera indica TaxID=29780 RepID=UPI001CFAAED6|nr:uncharacterized protein LOC123220908 [Mangifera indica]
MDKRDKSWMNLPRYSDKYMNGVNDFLDKAFSLAAHGNVILCPCKKCHLRYWYCRNTVYEHLIIDGITPGYNDWYFHGEVLDSSMNIDDMGQSDKRDMGDDIDGLLHDTFRGVINEDIPCNQEFREGQTDEAKKFFKLLEEGKEELYLGCQNFSKLSFTIRLYLLKCIHGISNVAITNILELLREAFPHAKLPTSFNVAKKMVKDLGLEYQKIHACPNDCMLFWDENETLSSCKVCGASRWKSNGNVVGNSQERLSKKGYQIPKKVFRYFPLILRLQRLFMCKKTADCMTWHEKYRTKDGNLRHPADGEAWKKFDSLYPHFAQDPRNVRLGLSSDGFNPFRTMSITYSTWSIILINYNLPQWHCMKPEYLILSSIIPGPSSPGQDIDIYMQPFIKEIRLLWEIGVDTYDASTNQTFKMRACLLWTVSDFPAYAMLSG